MYHNPKMPHLGDDCDLGISNIYATFAADLIAPSY